MHVLCRNLHGCIVKGGRMNPKRILQACTLVTLLAIAYEGYAILQSFNLATSYPCPPERVMLPVEINNRNDGLVLMYDEQTRQVYNMTVVDKCRTK